MKEIYQNKDNSYFSHTRIELLPFIPASIKCVLDVGCATGNFGQMLKELYNCSVWGVEPDDGSARAAKKKLDHVINAQFNKELDIPADQKFDCVFFNDVLEHLAEPEEALSIAAALLSDGGHVVASIPNIRFYPVMLGLLRYKDFRYSDAGVMDRTHLRFFTKKSMQRLFEEAGYDVNKIEGINPNKFKYFEIINGLMFNSMGDMRYPQFAIVAKLK